VSKYRPGELDQKIDFRRSILSDDGAGGQTETFCYIKKAVSAHVRPLSGKERERFDKLNAEELTLFVTRYRRDRLDISEDDTIIYDGDLYNIRRIPKRNKRSMYQEFYAERGVAV
jgi:SPP1 family predicted phage head-tail adaptor